VTPVACFLERLPQEVAETIRTQLVVQYATVSAAGVPIDTPTAVFTSADLATLDIATGLAYPAKAERVRRNPKVGLLIESGPDKPVISVAGVGVVRDRDLQGNLQRYLAETALVAGKTAITDWSIAREAVWYYARVFVCITPIHVRWWPNREAMDHLPRSWRAAPRAIEREPDQAPIGETSKPPEWPQPPWQELAPGALERQAPCHLTLLDGEGYPLPIGVREVRARDDGFHLAVPGGAPWREGSASLSFQGREIFVGRAAGEGLDIHLRVERALPLFPLVADVSQVLHPKADTRAALMKRLELEAARRGQAVPVMPRDVPQPTAGAIYRAARSR
jgi:hypothetical protein